MRISYCSSDVCSSDLSEFVLARAAAGIADETISGDVDALMEVRGWCGRPLWELIPTDLDRFFGEDQRRLATLTKVRKAQTLATYFEFLEEMGRGAGRERVGQ